MKRIKMEYKEIKVNFEDIRNVLEKWKGASINTGTIESIIKDFRLQHLKNI